MRKMTIYRSSSVLLAAAALAVAAGAAEAQDTLQTGQGQAPKVHVVSQGETLWSIAQQYFGDPFLWPEIYRINTLVVEDPHWIFPGEELQLAPADVTAVAQMPEPAPSTPPGQATPPPPAVAITEQAGQRPPAAQPEGQPVQMVTPGQEQQQVEAPISLNAPPPPPPTEDAPTVFMVQQATRGGLGGIRGRVFSYRAIRRGEFYASGFLTEGETLPWGKVLGASGTPTLANLRASSSAHVFADIDVQPPAGAEYRSGDTLLVARLGRQISGRWGRVVVPTAVAVVRRVGEDKVEAQIVEQFGRVADSQVAIPLEPFRDPGGVVPVPLEGGMEGVIVAPRDRNPVPGQQDILFINLGHEDGVALGDVFEVVRPALAQQGETAWEQVAVMHIVHVRSHSASGLLVGINDLGVEAGAKVRLIRKMPS